MTTDAVSTPETFARRRRVRRRPTRRALVLTHRWTSLVLGLLLVIETTSGVLVLFHTEYFRATHQSLYHHTASAHPVTAQQALETVNRQHPEFGAAWVSRDHGIYAVGDPSYTKVYGVDPGTGDVTGFANLVGGPMGFLVNLHDCGLTCVGYSGYVGALSHPVPSLGIGWLNDVSWGSAILGTLGALMILLAVTGIITWWPGIKRFSHGFRVRTRKGRFARDYDLHNLIGIVAVPFVLMWGVTGAAMEFPGVEKVWLAMTGGHAPDENRYVFTPHQAKGPAIGLNEATALAQKRYSGQVSYVALPQEGADYYSVSILGSYAPYRYRGFWAGDVTVYVDSHDPSHTGIVDPSKGQPAANTFYEKDFEASHFAWMVNGWWRLLWVPFGLAPLVLMVTGLSTWLVRRRNRKRRRRAAAA
ncbi:MAG TPA: PepSY-associated TM helix domain-containing protein [Mycobacteriales bacterium]|nr:PepSY-associated TM helix domain-containing protein [Mycobacteriales bacterium]